MPKRLLTVLIVALTLTWFAGPRSAAAVDFDAGTLQGTVSWNGSPVTGLATQNLSATYDYPNGTYRGVDVATGLYRFDSLAVGTYTPSIKFCCWTALAQGASVNVYDQQTTTADFDLTASAGMLVGSITINGAALPNPWINIPGASINYIVSDGAGSFATLVPPGSYSAQVRTQVGDTLGSFPLTVVAGQTTNVGAVDFAAGTLQGTVSWNGSPVTGLAAEGLSVRADHPVGYTHSVNPATGVYQIGAIAAGMHTPGISYSNALLVLSTSVAVSAQQTTIANFDLTASAGMATASITVNGAPLSNPVLSILNTNIYSVQGDTGGAFAMLLPPGSYTAEVASESAELVGSVPFDVVAGQTTALGTIDFSAGTLQGTISWNGSPVTGLVTRNLYMVTDYPNGGWRTLYFDGTYSYSSMAAGTHNVGVYACCTLPVGVTPPVTVSAGQTTTADIDLTSVAGKISGIITVNGIPLPYPQIHIPSASVYQLPNDSSGNFVSLLPHGSYTAEVRTQYGDLLGTFSFDVIAGQSTDVEIGSTPAGSNITLSLSGGLGSVGGILVIFSNVTTAGATTVVESGAGPPPATGFRIVGLAGQPRYWDIDTTAVYSGPITVCIRYDQSEVLGLESKLRLMHHDGSSWSNVTTSHNLDYDIICGQTTSISPFAVMQPVDSDGDNCLDVAELQTAVGSERTGGRRNPSNRWDYYDVGGMSGGPPDGIIDLPNDILQVILRYSPTGAPPYNAAYDRGPTTGPNMWNMTAPDGVIDLANDILGVIMQYLHDCR